MRTAVQEKHWRILSPNPKLQDEFVSQLSISPFIAQILINRGISSLKDAKEFLNKDLKSLHDPFLLTDMEKITDRIKTAIKNDEAITIYGDYDADGICSTAILYITIKELGARKCFYYLPNRMDEGYGLNKEAIYKCYENGTRLLITVDCGISNAEEISYANSLGMDVIVTDHHNPQGERPRCIGILNPKLEGSRYPFKDLAGVGVVYKLLEGLTRKTKSVNIIRHLDLVALGTIADIVPITGENRTLVHHGLLMIKNTTKTGLQKLKTKVRLNEDIDASHVAFRLAPRLNACGRIDTAQTSLKLLLTDNPDEAEELAGLLNQKNYERQRLEEEVLKTVIGKVETTFNFNNEKIIVTEGNNWPVGVIGIVASRLVTKYNRPAIVISLENGLGKGSGRSIKNFDLLKALKTCKDYFIKFGGHAHAAGMSIEELLIPSFRRKINEYAEAVLKPHDFVPAIDIDAVLNFRDITFDLIDKLEGLGPFGHDNPRPVFLSKALFVYREPQIVGKDHLKLWLKKDGKVIEAIGFGMADWLMLFDENKTLDIVYRLAVNTWQEKEIIQLQIMDMRCS